MAPNVNQSEMKLLSYR